MNTHQGAAAGTFVEDLFSGRSVLVSGGSSGIGLEIACGFRDLGAHVVATGSSEQSWRMIAPSPGMPALSSSKPIYGIMTGRSGSSPV